MPTDKELAERTIIDKINLVAARITHDFQKDTDLKVAQTVQALAAAYKDLRNTPEIMEEDTMMDKDKLKAEIIKACMDEHFMPVKLLSCDDITDIIDKFWEQEETNGQQTH